MKTVRLSARHDAGSASFDELVFREPELGDYRKIGKVIERQGDIVLTYPEAIWGYVERLVQEVNPQALAKLPLDDALKIEAAIVGFFLEASSRNAARETSSSVSDGAPPTSKA